MPKVISRRTLIELSVAGAAAFAAAEAEALDRPSLPKDQKIGFAVVGLGKLAQGQIIPGLRKAKSAKLVALVSGHPDKAKRIAAAEGLPDDAIYNYDDYDRIAKIRESRSSTSSCPTACTPNIRSARSRRASMCCAKSRWRPASPIARP